MIDNFYYYKQKLKLKSLDISQTITLREIYG